MKMFHPGIAGTLMQTVHNRLTFLFLLVSLCLLPGCGGSPMDVSDVNVLNEAAKKDKNFFNGKKILDARLNGLKDGSYGVVLEDMTIRNLTINNVQMWRAYFKNVTFVDCTFVKVDFWDSKFENVKFIRGSISGDKKPNPVDYSEEYQTKLDRVRINRLLFDGVEIGRSVHINFVGDADQGGGIVVMRNVTVSSREKHTAWLLGGIDLHVRIDNCVVEDQYGVNVRGQNSSAYVTNSRFTNAGIKLAGKVVWLENCTLKRCGPLTATIVVVRNCRLEGVGVGVEEDGERYFLVKNTFTNAKHQLAVSLLPAREYTTRDNAHLYFYADGHIPGRVRVNSGNVHIYDAEIDELTMHQQQLLTRPMASLNLQNVKIGKGDWERGTLHAGKWENVRLGKPIDLNKAIIGPIIGHKVEFPNGYPWIHGHLDITNSPTPLEFDKPPVPTLEELGLAQFWKEHDFPVEQY